MKRTFSALAAFVLCSAALHADVTIVQTTTVEGGMASMAAAAGQTVNPTMTTRIKGTKSRADVEMGAMTISTILDLATKQVIVLRPDLKTATVMTVPAAGTPRAGGAQTTGPKVDTSVNPTGKSQVIDGVKCDEYAFTTTLDMSAMGGPQMPPEAVSAMQGMKMAMAGALWVAKDAPGASEYLAYQKAIAAADMAGAASNASGMNVPGMDKVMRAMAALEGVTYLTEMTITIEGTGQIADMMRQMGPMKVTTKVSSLSAAALTDDLFKVPEGYTVTKQ
jgi:hypothetical protein